MSWSAHIQHTPQGLALTFPEPLSRLDMTSDVAAHLASLLAVEAAHRMRVVVANLDHENGSDPAKTEAGRSVRLITNTHALCCDCDPCLNGGQS